MMDWLNIHRSTLASEEFLGCEPVHRATWLCLLAYCADQENGGTIRGADQWGDRKWQQVVRVTKAEAMDSCPLWKWVGPDLVVWAYPIEKENEVARNRANGKRGGRPPKPEQNHPVSPGFASGLSETEPSGSFPPKRKGIGKERKGKEKEREAAPRPARCSDDEFDHLLSPAMRNDKAFLDGWHRWCRYRRETRRRISESAAKEQIKALHAAGIPASLAAISRSIANDWTGLFPESAPNAPTHAHAERVLTFADIAKAFPEPIAGPLPGLYDQDGDA